MFPIIVGVVPAVAYVVTSMVITKRNSDDIKSILIRMTALESDVAVIKAICQERSGKGGAP
jgi:hypothetical protein